MFRSVKMREELWGSLNHFTPDENWGDWQRMCWPLLTTLDDMRQYAGIPLIILRGWEPRPKFSYHNIDGVSMAVDGYFKTEKGTPLNVVDQYIIASRFDRFNGIGVYPHWDHPGLHLDIRVKEKRFDFDARWMGVLNDKGEQIYLPLTWENLLRYCR